MTEDHDYKPDPNRQSLTPSASEFFRTLFGVLGEASLRTAWWLIKAVLIVAGILLLGAVLYAFISSAVATGITMAQ
jgi:hypothetical protein